MARPDTAFMGFYAVRPKYQKHGVGKKLWSQTTSRLNQTNINIGLYGVDEMYDKYKRGGFDINDPARLCIFERDLKQLDLDTLRESLDGYRTEKFDHNSSEEQFKKLVEYDRAILHYSREKLLRLYLKTNDCPLTIMAIKEGQTNNTDQSATTYNRVASIEEQEEVLACCKSTNELSVSDDPKRKDNINETTIATISGYGCIRADNTGGCMIGPIYAESSDIAELLTRKLIENYNLPLTNNVLIMSLTTNKQALNIITKAGFHEAEQCGRLFTKFIPSINYSKVYSIHSPNFTLF